MEGRVYTVHSKLGYESIFKNQVIVTNGHFVNVMCRKYTHYRFVDTAIFASYWAIIIPHKEERVSFVVDEKFWTSLEQNLDQFNYYDMRKSDCSLSFFLLNVYIRMNWQKKLKIKEIF